MNRMNLFTIYILVRGIFMMIGFVVLIKPLGLNGAALSVLLACICDIMYLAIALNKVLHLNLLDLIKSSFVKPIILGILCGLIIYCGKSLITSWIYFITAGFVYFILFLFFGRLLKILDEQEMLVIKKGIRKVINVH